ncbi:TPA: tail fiber assembly protein [Yersinia enterocolitica]|nr:tail fiber assembly protein [Yersinia enterocolitica]HEN3568310.1 tail fiber assembly protein [Yersinia enterocolitica]HEN3572563.1 tail fiber assembly protein [Yersinia enterocolitica]HEN3576816.1 tail fiber assembly protein [Yersinia enterocolitica]HEN3580935.1 tail fiber assembly protein [Yersinia enterocolitica]
MATVVLNDTVFNYHYETKEFVGKSDYYIAPYTGLPAFCTEIKPLPAKKGYAVIFNEEAQQWEYVEDHQSAWFTTRKHHPTSPTNPFDRWNSTKWVKDSEAEKQYYLAEARQKKSILLEEAKTQIEILKDSIEFDMSSLTAESELVAWRKYRLQLNQLDISAAPGIDWPKQPA